MKREIVEYCFSCKTETNSLVIDLPHFRHIDFSTVSESETVSTCNCCGLIIYRGDRFEEEASIFRTEKYAASRQTSQVIYSQEYPDGRMRSELQAQIIDGLLLKNDPSVLDVGCFDSSLLNEVKKHRPGATLVGYDIKFTTLLERDENSLILTNELDKIFRDRYDAVIFSHSLMYINNLEEIILKVNRSLNEDGLLYVQVPDIDNNPYYGIMGDQKYLFTRDNLLNVFSSFFEIKVQRIAWFPREVVCIGRRDGEDRVKALRNNHIFERCVSKLRKYRKRLLENNGPKKVCIFGTTVAAAFVHETLGMSVLYFVDESSEKYESGFRGLEVRHPWKVGKNEEVLVPPGPWEHTLANKLTNIYGLTILPI